MGHTPNNTSGTPKQAIEIAGNGSSKVNWSRRYLTVDMVIEEGIIKAHNFKAFMKEHVGATFYFNLEFTNWMNNNIGKTLGDAVDEWKRLDALSKDENFEGTVIPHEVYKQYMRDFFKDNPNKTVKVARKYWKIKRTMPGDLKYSKADLLFDVK